MSTLRITTVAGSLIIAISAVVLANGMVRPGAIRNTEQHQPKGNDNMQLGNFSVSLAVKDLKASMAFYEQLDFKQVAGNVDQNYVILQNDTSTIGLFQGMFEENILTFNPGWNRKSETLKEFQDVRDLQATIKERGIVPVIEADATTDGPASFVIVDPDGNSILVDQHVPKPAKDGSAQKETE